MSTQALAGKFPINDSGALPGGIGRAYGFFRMVNSTSVPGSPTGTILSGNLYDISENSQITISNLTTPIALSAGLCIWLNVPVDGSTLLPTGSASVVTGATYWPASTIWASGSQTAFNIPIAKVSVAPISDNAAPGFDFPIGTDTYHLYQLLASHLRCYHRSTYTGPALYAEAWPGLGP